MKTRSTTPLFFAMAIAILFVLVLGCQKPSEPVANQSAAGDDDTTPSIRQGETPTEQQQQTMLAAKEALFTKLSGRLMEAMGSQGPAGAITVCQNEATQIAAEVSDSHDLKIGRTGVRLRNTDNQPPTWAKPLTESKTDTPTFVVLDNGDAAALLPIKMQVQCVMCHGPRDQIAPVIQDQLARSYPNDEAIGFHEGDLRGWFWVQMGGQP